MHKILNEVNYKKLKIGQYDGPPYSYSVTIRGKKKTMSGFDEEHIKAQIFPRKATKIVKLKEGNNGH